MKMSAWLFWFVGISVFTVVALWTRDAFREQVWVAERFYHDAQAVRGEFNPSLKELQNPRIQEQRRNLDAAVASAKAEFASASGWMDMCSSASLMGIISLAGLMVVWPMVVDWRRDPRRKELVDISESQAAT